MDWMIPGTVIEIPRDQADQIENRFDAMFLPGDMKLSQVAAITGLEPYMIQNWVKRGFLTPPEKKKYTLRQLCRIININMLRPVLPMERICGLMHYVNGQLDDDSDDVIDDSVLFFMFVKMCSRVGELKTMENREQLLDEIMATYQETNENSRMRVRQVLKIMFTAWIAAQVGREADRMLTMLLEQ